MGKEQWYWGGKSSKRSSAQTAVDRVRDTSSSSSSAGCMCAVFQFFDFHHFQFPNLHHPPQRSHNFKPSPSSFHLPEEEPNCPKGVEAPRNSLKSEGTSLSSIIEEEGEQKLNIPMGIQIKTCTSSTGGSASSKAGATSSDFSSDTSSSPGAKTPSLVARLMGLNLLPETNSPTFTSSTLQATQNNYNNLSRSTHSQTQPLKPRQPYLQNKARHLMEMSDIGTTTDTHSLPETPRISSARRSDVDPHHRLSLQINKENIGISSTEDLDFSRLSALRMKQLRAELLDHNYTNESRSPGYYARQIVKQVKESVSRKVGSDITNACGNINNRDHDHHQLVKQLKSKKFSKGLAKLDDQASLGKIINPSSSSSLASNSVSSCSPRLRFTDSKSSTTANYTSTTSDHHQSFQVSSRPTLIISSSSSALRAPVNVNHQSHAVKVSAKPKQPLKKRRSSSSSKAGGGGAGSGGREGFGPRLQKMQEETFVRPSTATSRTNIPDKKKCKKTPLSNNLLSLNVPTLLAVKKSPSPPAQKQPARAEVSDNDRESKRRSSQLSSSQSQKYYDQPEPTTAAASHVLEPRETIIISNSSNPRKDVVLVVDLPNGSATSTPSTSTTTGRGGSDLNQYITGILGRTGISTTSQVSFANWFSPSHPLDPSIFHRLETSVDSSTTTTNTVINLSSRLRLRSNRRLLFDIVDEILVDILRPYINLKPWINNNNNNNNYKGSNWFYVNRGAMQGSELIDTLCKSVESFPCSDCQVLEDIDALIDKDLPNQLKIQGEMAFEEEGEGLVMEIERDILDTLVNEAALVLVGTFTCKLGAASFWM